MKIRFSIHYRTEWGQQLGISGSHEKLGKNSLANAPLMTTFDGENWELELNLPDSAMKNFSYKFFVYDERDQSYLWEWGAPRQVAASKKAFKEIQIQDNWRPQQEEEKALYTSAFQDVLLKRKTKTSMQKSSATGEDSVLRFQLCLPHVPQDKEVCVLGSHEALGHWDEKRALRLNGEAHPFWTADIRWPETTEPISYKYGIYNPAQKEVVEWEAGPNRLLHAEQFNGRKDFLLIKTDEHFRSLSPKWRGTGVAVPVFSLRTEQSTGVGEFLDIKKLVDWSKIVGVKMIQLLPINDTTAAHKWTDSYPYSAISVFAMHPMYLNLEALPGSHPETMRKTIRKKRDEFNSLEHVEYVEVNAFKWQIIREIFAETKKSVFHTKAFNTFFQENERWLKPYASFCYLRDLYKTADFKEWKEFSVFSEKKIQSLTDPKSPHYDEIALHYFVQFQLHRQLLEASNYAKENGVILKGDIPIGIFRHSVDAWTSPELYNMDMQAGAPPDAFAKAGQNWGFPTYNWKEMAKNGFKWWTDRLKTMSDYFDAFRIDHILGFFRIWQIPNDQIEGILGYFNPAIPVREEEFRDRQISFDYKRLCEPYIREHMLQEIFGTEADKVKKEYLIEYEQGRYRLKNEFSKQKKIEEHLSSDPDNVSEEEMAHAEWLKKGLFSLISEVLFIPEPGKTNAYHPRVAFHSTYSFQDLDENTRRKLDEVYVDYFYSRQEDFWREQAMVKLPAIKEATNMLICGEDLGMVPKTVPKVMSELGILNLNIQRLSDQEHQEFFHPGEARYLSVVSPSCHDMSTIRGWWEEDPEQIQRYYSQMLGKKGSAPYFCEPHLVEEVVRQHLDSPAMWAVFPIQDFLGMDAQLRRN
ncbi:MAG: 4-alpha-glucanotransferase, partial [Cytophagales bacterium]|nr:4-alpha-glucanotransferase [Cytophagales bacterium]